MKKAVSILGIIFLLNLQAYSQVTEITADTIHENTTWSDTIKITKDLTIALGTKVTVNPGTVVEFQGHHMINLRGAIDAYGSPEDTIVFTRPDTIGFHNLESDAGGWNGIKVDNYDFQMWQSDTSFFRFCKFENSKSIIEDRPEGGVFSIRMYGKIMLDNCLFTNNASRTTGGAIFMEGDIEPGIFHCTFMDNYGQEGGAICLFYKARPVIYNCLFYQNAGTYGGAVKCNATRSAILNCTFSNNTALIEGGAILLENSRDLIIGNLIVNNSAEGGGGLKVSSSWPVFYNNTVCFNYAGWGGGIEFWGLCNADLYNNIIWGNEATEFFLPNQIAITSLTATPNFYHCLIEDGTDSIENYLGQAVQIISDDPQFIYPSDQTGTASNGLESDFSLEPFSPAINQGSNEVKDNLHIEIDQMGNPRILHGIIDIGCFEKQLGSFAVNDTIFENTVWIADTVRIDSDIVIVDSATLEISPGTFVEFQGHYKLIVFGSLQAAGSEEFPITFTINDTTGFADNTSNEGSWGGIIFDNSQFGANAAMNDNDSSILRYCTLQYAKNMADDWNSPVGGAIQVRYFSSLEIARCTIQYNKSVVGGGLGITMFSHPYIHNNVIYSNFAKAEGGGVLISNSSSPGFIGNFILNNTAKREFEHSFGGGLMLNYADPVIVNNVFCNNYASTGGGIHMDDSQPLFSNNTVCNNKAAVDAGGMMLYKSTPNIMNSVFRGNSSSPEDGNVSQVMLTESVNFYNNNIEGGIESIIPNWMWDFAGEDIDNIDSNPGFKDPTQGAGPEYDALAADWSITDYSGNINKGHPESQQFLGEIYRDIAGKRRYNHEIIDIGAFENQGEPIHITVEPFNQFACVGDTIEFSVEVEGNARFQWFKDGELIQGADTNVLQLDSVDLKDKADYICFLYNGYGLLISNNVTLEVNAPPEILLQTESQWVKEDANLKLEIHGRGTEPIFYAWMKNGAWISEQDRPEYRIKAMGYEDEGTYYCYAGNVCGETISDPITLFVAPQICMVTVDVETGDNLVIWEKKGTAPISAYNIYRESIVAGEYEPIGNVTSADLSIFLDTISRPETQAYIYKISAIDDQGRESDLALCKPHKTIHLITTTNLAGGATQLDWDHYYGFSYGTFHIYRRPYEAVPTTNFSIIHSISSSLTAYTDPNPNNDTLEYRISVERPEDCAPTGEGKKADSGPYSHAMSNVEDNRLQSTSMEEPELLKDIEIYPNPFSETTTILFPNPSGSYYRINIIDLSGKVLRSEQINGDEYVINRGNLESGYYIIELNGERIYRSKLIVE